MTQFDARMGFAPALLCIEEEPLKKTVSVNFGFRGRTNDPFEVGDHNKVSIPTKTPKLMQVVQVREEDCVQGARAERFAAQTKFEDPTCSINEFMGRYARGLGVHDELTFYTNGQDRTNIFRGANDMENKTATEIQMKIRAAEQRMLRSVLDNMSISRPMPAPLGSVLDDQRRQEKQLRMLTITKEKCGAASARLDAAINGKPIESTDFWANLNKASHLGGSPFARFKDSADNPSLEAANAKLRELSGGTIQTMPGETLKFKRFKPQLTGDWGFDPAKADES